MTLTAPSAGECFDMEGLEYLGDVVLKFLTTNYLLHVRLAWIACGKVLGQPMIWLQ